MRNTIPKHAISFLMLMIILVCILSGCVRDVPLAVAPGETTCQAGVKTRKVQANVGIYLSDDLRRYAYKRKIMGMTFRMNIGASISPILTQMGSAITSKDVVFVDSLPPYNHDYKPDVDAVIEPEIVYCDGNVKGTVTGSIDARIIMRMTVYDVGGNVLWQGEEAGVNRSGELTLAGNYLGILENADRTGYGAVFSAASMLVDDFSATFPGGLYTLDEGEIPCTPINDGNASALELFKQYYCRGRVQYERRKFCRALRSFEKAAILNPGDLSTLFYMSACYAYAGDKDKALENFRKFYGLCQTSQEANDAMKWIELLKDPLEIVLGSREEPNSMEAEGSLIQRALTNSGMYNIVKLRAAESRPFKEMAPSEFNNFLDQCHEKGIKIVLVDDVSYTVRKAVEDGPASADVAMDHMVRISVRAFSTKNKELRTEIKIIEKAGTIGERNKAEELAIKKQLLERGATKILLRLLENEIF